MRKTIQTDYITTKKNNDNLIWTNVNFPSSNVDIDTFEENSEKIAVNVYFLIPKKANNPYYFARKVKLKEQSIKLVC